MKYFLLLLIISFYSCTSEKNLIEQRNFYVVQQNKYNKLFSQQFELYQNVKGDNSKKDSARIYHFAYMKFNDMSDHCYDKIKSIDEKLFNKQLRKYVKILK